MCLSILNRYAAVPAPCTSCDSNAHFEFCIERISLLYFIFWVSLYMERRWLSLYMRILTSIRATLVCSSRWAEVFLAGRFGWEVSAEYVIIFVENQESKLFDAVLRSSILSEVRQYCFNCNVDIFGLWIVCQINYWQVTELIVLSLP